MGIVQKNTILSELTVRETMRRQVISLPLEADLAACINRLIKFKVNALLITGEGMASPVGVVSKTDIMGAYYAGLPIDLPAGDIMISPPLFCHPEDTLEAALEEMRHHGVYRLYVQGDGRQGGGGHRLSRHRGHSLPVLPRLQLQPPAPGRQDGGRRCLCCGFG